MCGIAGILKFTDESSAARQLETMNERLRHRGPDGQGVWIDASEKIGFAHRRLSIIDLSDRAAQPMHSGDGRFVITYNGEVYNYRELRTECEALGSVFRTTSDTEVILEAYRHWGTDAFAKFTGMWALALCDRRERRVVFCRDPFAIKPLFYGRRNGSLYFASEPKALHAVQAKFAEVDEVTVALFEEQGYIDRGEWTFFKHVKRFPHAHYGVVDLADEGGRLAFHRYWSPPSRRRKISPGDAAEELRRLLIRSVDIHLRSDVPVGACLSGGLDSSATVCIGTSLLPAGGHFNTFTTRFPDHKDIDETFWAEKVIEHTKARARYTEPDFDLFQREFDRLVYIQDEPFGSTSIFSQYAIFKRIAETEVIVVLDGQGADEQLAGYHGFFDIYLTKLATTGRWLKYLREGASLHRVHGFDFRSHRKKAWRGLCKRLKQWKWRRAAAIAPPLDDADLDEARSRIRKMTLDEPDFDQTLTNLVCETNLPQLLRYEDRNSMAHSIESRVPFLEVELVNFVLSLPSDLKIRRGVTKAVLRDALSGIVPDEVRLRVDKLGFPAPEKDWMKRGFDVDVATAGGRHWREVAVRKWRSAVMG